MCSRTEPFIARLSSIKGRPPIRALRNRDSQAGRNHNLSQTSQSFLTDNDNSEEVSNSMMGDSRGSHACERSPCSMTDGTSPGKQSTAAAAAAAKPSSLRHHRRPKSDDSGVHKSDPGSSPAAPTAVVFRRSPRGGEANVALPVRWPPGRLPPVRLPPASLDVADEDGEVGAVEQHGARRVIGYNGEPIPDENAIERARTGERSTLLLFILLALISLGIVSVVHQISKQEDEPTRELTEKGDMAKIFENLKASFPSQTKRSWAFFNGPLRRVLRDGSQSEEPAVLLLAGDPTTIRCFVEKAATQLNSIISTSSPIEPLVLQGRSLQQSDVFAAKTSIDDSVRRYFDESGGKIVVFHDLDLIPAEAVLLLHGYSDHENAPYKDAFFFLTVSRKYGKSWFASDGDQRAIERKVAEDLDTGLSQSLGLDATKALMARIANSVVIVSPEDIISAGCSP